MDKDIRIHDLECENDELHKRLDELSRELEESNRLRDQYLYELVETRKSRSYKIGLAITSLPRKVINRK